MLVTLHFYPGIPNTPKPRDGGRSPISGRMYESINSSSDCAAFGFTIVWVLQPKYPITLLPTGKSGFLDSTILATWDPIIVIPNGNLRTYGLMYGSTERYSASARYSEKKKLWWKHSSNTYKTRKHCDDKVIIYLYLHSAEVVVLLQPISNPSV